MKRFLIFISLVMILYAVCIPAIVRAQDKTMDTAPTKERQPESDPGVRTHDLCPPGDRRCKLDRELDELERRIRETSEQYRKGEAWKMPPKKEDQKPTKTKYGTRALRYPLLIPVYAFRLVTWPVAITANQLIKHGVIRKVVDIVSNDQRTLWVYPTIEFGFGSGFGGGIGIKHFDLFNQGYELNANYTIHINMNQEAYLSLHKRDVAYIKGKPLAFKIVNKFKHHNRDDFYGIGIGSSSSSAKYGIDELQSGGWFGYEVIKDLLMRIHLHYIWDNTEQGSGGQPVNARFSPSHIPAFGQSIQYLDVGLGLVHDTRDALATPQKGGIRKFTFRRFVGLGNNNYDYNEYDAEVAQFFNIWKPRHVFVLRTAWTYQQQTGNPIPFYRLARLDVDSPDRAYNYGRFRDRACAVFNAEYRFPVWDYMDGQLFYDTGRVFHEWSDFSFKHFKHAGGVGLRLRTSDFFLARFQIAFGSEGVKFLFKTSQAF